MLAEGRGSARAQSAFVEPCPRIQTLSSPVNHSLWGFLENDRYLLPSLHPGTYQD